MGTLPSISAATRPWLELVEGGHGAPPSTGGPARALLAAQVRPRPFDERATYRWGWNNDSTRQEAAARQQQFLVGLHDASELDSRRHPAGPTLALHAWRDPAQPGLSLCLVAGVDGRDAADARVRALDLWRGVAATFPYDYEIAPIESAPAFAELTGLGLLGQVSAPDELVEIRRFEAHLPTDRGLRLLLGLWQGNDRADEVIWRALAVAPTPLLLSIRLRPTRLTPGEWPRLEGLMVRSPLAELLPQRHLFDWAAGLYEQRRQSWAVPFLVQVHLIAPGGVPLYVQRAVGAALTYRAGAPAQPGYQAAGPADEAQAAEWRAALGRLSFTTTPPAAGLLARLHLLADVDEALTVCRWPYPPEEGLPGVAFR